jgi:predicted nucleic acid-binding protein
MVYLDTSVLLAHLLAEDKTPPEALWNETLVSSRLIEYETWNRIHALGLGKSHGDVVRQAIGRIALLELVSSILHRALDPFPIAVRTLDALHLATITFLQEQGQEIKLASYDDRMLKAARKMRVPFYPV